jgi:ribosomal protein S18 acetylase RimI-like enzyme
VRNFDITTSLVSPDSVSRAVVAMVLPDGVTLSWLDKAHPTERHYYLQFIGVNPDHQGKGLGSALM